MCIVYFCIENKEESACGCYPLVSCFLSGLAAGGCNYVFTSSPIPRAIILLGGVAELTVEWFGSLAGLLLLNWSIYLLTLTEHGGDALEPVS